MDEYSKPTFKAVNDAYLLFGFIDWRYAVIATLPAMACGRVAHSWPVGLLAAAVLQGGAYLIYSKDGLLPLIVLMTLMDKKKLCPFKE